MAAAPQQYAAVSVSNVVATTCQYDALKYVSFPVQTLGKCAKMIPVMIWGRLILQKRYNLREYALAGQPLVLHRLQWQAVRRHVACMHETGSRLTHRAQCGASLQTSSNVRHLPA